MAEMDLILDANILIKDFQQSNPDFRVTLEGLHRTSARMLVPEIVFGEVVGKYEQELHALAVQSRKMISEYRRVTGVTAPDVLLESNIPNEVQSFATRLRQKLVSNATVFLPWPSVSHEDVVQRVLARRRPSKDEKGYRDILIWESVLTHVAATEGRCIFVTENIKDFCRDGTRTIHPDLQHDLAARNISDGRLQLETSLKAVNDLEFIPVLTQLNDVKRQIEAGTYQGFDARKWLASELKDSDDVIFEAALDNDPSPGQNVSLRSDFDLPALTILDVRMLSTNELLVELQASVVGELDVTFDDYRDGAEDYAQFSEFEVKYDLIVDDGEVVSSELRRLGTSEFWSKPQDAPSSMRGIGEARAMPRPRAPRRLPR